MGWIRVDRMMVKGVGKSINVLFDIIDYTVPVWTSSRMDWATLLARIPWKAEGDTVE